jgi:hypothetical protein
MDMERSLEDAEWNKKLGLLKTLDVHYEPSKKENRNLVEDKDEMDGINKKQRSYQKYC